MAVNEWASITLPTAGPINLKKTFESGQSSFSIPLNDKIGRYYIVAKLPETKKNILCRFLQEKTKLQIEIASIGTTLSDNEINEMKKILRTTLGLNMNITQFYEQFQNDPLTPALKAGVGLRLTRAHDLFESLICSILTQNNSVWKFNSQVRKIKELMGEKYPVEHFMVYTFPEPKILFRLKHLLKEAHLGYREDYIIATTEEIANYQVRLEKLIDAPTEEALKTLLKLKGIGPKVADMFLLYGLGKIDVPPIDIWIQRGVTKLFFNNIEKSLEECRDKLIEHYGKWAGLAQLYLYNWMRLNTKPSEETTP